MGVITTATLIVFGVVTVVGVSGAIIHNATQEQRNEQKRKELEAANASWKSAMDFVSGVKTKLVKAKDYLVAAKKDFKNGGHVLDNVPLANPEFTSCINKLDSAIANANTLINDFKETIEYNKKEIQKLK